MPLILGVIRFHPAGTAFTLEFFNHIASSRNKRLTPKVRVNYPPTYIITLGFLQFTNLGGKFRDSAVNRHLGMYMNVVCPVYNGPDDVVGLAVVRVHDANDGVGVSVIKMG